VIILSAEDDAADTLVPRLMAHGADLTRCHIVEAVRERGAPRQFSLLRDLERLEALLDRIGGAALMTVDVVDSYLGDTDTHRNAAVRGVLAPLAELAARRQLAVLGLTHFRKASADRAVLRFTGSIAFVGQARVGWITTPEIGEDGEPTGRRLFVRGKGNVAPDIGGLAYMIEGCTVGGGDGPSIETCRVVWAPEAVSVTADEALAPPRSADAEDGRSATEEAVEWLTAYLGDLWWPSADVITAAREAGITGRTLERARVCVGVQF
jgi:putative DNA primase/helicase